MSAPSALVMVIMLAVPWSERLAARVGEGGRSQGSESPPPPARRLPPQDPVRKPPSAAEVAAEMRTFVAEVVEPAIATLRAHEVRAGSEEICFASAGGQHLRYRCCVYFSTLAAALLEQRYGAGGGAFEPPGSVRDLYALMARWFLVSADAAGAQAARLAAELQRGASRVGYSLEAMRADAAKLPAPLGKYEAPLRVLGAAGVLRRCEVSTVHTYLVFSSASLDDVYVDLSPKQFYVMSEWMGSDGHWEAVRRARLFDEAPEHFVGSAAEMEAVYTAESLRANMRAAYDAHGASVAGAEFEDDAQLRQMHMLRNDALFALRDPARRRQMCGRPSEQIFGPAAG